MNVIQQPYTHSVLNYPPAVLSNSYITPTRDVSGLNCNARGGVVPESGAI